MPLTHELSPPGPYPKLVDFFCHARSTRRDATLTGCHGLFSPLREENHMSDYDSNLPFRIWYSHGIGAAPGHRGPELKFYSYRTLESARAAVRGLPPGCKFVRITDGPDAQLIE